MAPYLLTTKLRSVIRHNLGHSTQFIPTLLKCPKIAGANSVFFKIAGAKAPIAPVLNTPLNSMVKYMTKVIYSDNDGEMVKNYENLE